MDALNLKEVLVRKPFKRITPIDCRTGGLYKDGKVWNDNYDDATYEIVSQTDFMREYDPSGHMINNPLIYPDKKRKDPDTGQEFSEPMARCAFAFQRIITVKQLAHLCGNDIQFEMPSSKDNKQTNETFFKFKEGWSVKNMEIAWFESAKSVKITGDVAFVGYKKGGKFHWKVLSYMNGDSLYPHYDAVTGELSLFARKYSDMDENGKETTTYVEVWDEKKLYRFKKDNTGAVGLVNRIKEVFGLHGYRLISEEPHNFPFIPVSYKRDDNGACWSFSQGSIDQYELAFSQLVQNNTAFAFPIMYMKGEEVSLIGDMTGAVKGITMAEDEDAGFLNTPNGSDLFTLQLSTLYKLIYEQSFAVIPPEVRSGDMPGVAVKLLYSPAVEFAMKDAQEYQQFLDNMVRIYMEGYGTEIGQTTSFNQLEVYSWILPYVPQNDSELIQNLAVAVQNGFESRQTASEKIPMIAKNSEWERILKEQKEQQQNDILAQIELNKATQPNDTVQVEEVE